MNDKIKKVLQAIGADIETLAQLIFETDSISNNTKVNKNTLKDSQLAKDVEVKINELNNPSFIIFKGLNSGNNTIVPFNITIKAYTPTEDLPAAANLLFTEINTLSKHTFQGTKNKNLIAGNSNFFYISTNPTITANNLASCIRNDGWFRSNFDISTNNNVITLLARRKNPNVSFRIEKTTANNSFIDVASTEYIITNNDTLFNSVVELDVYNSATNRYITSASKTYVENDVWFDVNNVLNRTVKSYPNLLFIHNIILLIRVLQSVTSINLKGLKIMKQNILIHLKINMLLMDLPEH